MDDRAWDGWQHWLNGHELSKLRETVKDREAWHAAVHGVTKSWTWPSDWTKTSLETFSKVFMITGTALFKKKMHLSLYLIKSLRWFFRTYKNIIIKFKSFIILGVYFNVSPIWVFKIKGVYFILAKGMNRTNKNSEECSINL